MMPTRIKPFARKEPNLNRKIVKNHCQNNESIQINHPLIESDYFHKSLHPFYPFYSYISQMLRQIYDMASYAHRAIKAVYWACGDFWWLDQSEIHLGLKYKTQVFCSISSAAKLKLPDYEFFACQTFQDVEAISTPPPPTDFRSAPSPTSSTAFITICNIAWGNIITDPPGPLTDRRATRHLRPCPVRLLIK